MKLFKKLAQIKYLHILMCPWNYPGFLDAKALLIIQKSKVNENGRNYAGGDSTSHLTNF